MVGSALAALGSWLLCPHLPPRHLWAPQTYHDPQLSLSWVMTAPSLLSLKPWNLLCFSLSPHIQSLLTISCLCQTTLASPGSLQTPFKWAPCFTLLLSLSPHSSLGVLTL